MLAYVSLPTVSVNFLWQAVKLLFDANLSSLLARSLRDIYPGSTHVRFRNLNNASDEAVWKRAFSENYAIVTKDADFHEFCVLLGFPP